MKAIVCTGYGGAEVLQIQEVPKPSPASNEVLVKVHATTCHIGDVKVRSFDVPFWQMIPFRLYLGLRKPRRSILGMELAGEVEAVGDKVKRFNVGDAVFATTGFEFGAYAQYVCLPEDAKRIRAGLIVPMPDNMDFHQAAAGIATGGLTALHLLKMAKLQPRQAVLIYGASGSVGVFAIQLARYFGTNVTGVCSSSNIDMVKSLGANQVLDYTEDNFNLPDACYDVIIDAVDKLPRAKVKRALKPGGTWLNPVKNTDINEKILTTDLIFLKALAEAGKLKTVIDRTYAFEDIVEAHRYVEKGHKKGHVVISLDHLNHQ